MSGCGGVVVRCSEWVWWCGGEVWSDVGEWWWCDEMNCGEMR